jgi:uncharacterized cupin superfamily protein/catechol 2,3-dioxygenase-like lactoylglutathione lyase family enzyme
MSPRPDCIRHYSELQEPDDAHYPNSDELLSIGSPLAKRMGLTRLGIHHELLLPGRRTSFPHAESAEEEFAYVIEGYPDVWLDGVLHPLVPGDAVAFPAGTGQAHTFINNSDRHVRLLVVGETPKPENLVHYPLNPEEQARRPDVWVDVPKPALGPHDGMGRPGTRVVHPEPIDRIDHFVLTVADVEATCAFYVAAIGVTVVKGPGTRCAIQFGRNKINLHTHGREWAPRAQHPTPGSGDFCLISVVPLETIQTRLAAAGVPIELGPVERPGALGPMQSVYFRDPDQNLVEVSCYPPGV